MKKLITTSVFVFAIAGLTFAQSNKRTSAIMAYKNATECMQKQDLECSKKNILEAKGYIDECALHEDTKNDAKTLFYRGEIYLTLSMLGALDPTMKEYATEENGKIVSDSYKAAMANKNKKFDPTDQITLKMTIIRTTYLNQGVEAFNKKDYKSAYAMFAGGAEAFDVLGQVDSLAHYNAGLAAERQGKFDTAAIHYKKCTEVGYNGAEMYNLLINAYTESKQDDAALKAIKEGTTKYPGNKDLLISEVNYHLKKGNKEEAQKATNLAIEKDPKNPLLYFVVGTIYDDLKQYELAEQSYKKAIELKADYFDALYNLGAMYHNFGVELVQKIQDITDNTLYQSEKKKADEKFSAALPYLEKCRALDAKDKNTMIMMKNCYGRLGENDKWKEMDELLKNN